MAERPIYIPRYESELLVETKYIEFEWFPGLAPIQKQKSIKSLHQSAKESGICRHPLEVSSKSIEALGVELSAFNLRVKTEKHNREFTVESAYQSSKVFQNGGPYKDLLYGPSLAAKKDPRLKDSGAIIGFEFFGTTWNLEPRTAFYDWLYINALRKNPNAVEELDGFDGFTDIEFNPKKSLNCQAYSVALFKSLKGRGLLADALTSKEAFLDVIGNRPINTANENTITQSRLL